MATSVTEDSSPLSPGAPMSQVKRWLKNWQLLDRQYNQGWLALHKELAEYICLGRGRFINRGEMPNQKTRAAQKVVNNTATDSLHMLGAGLHGGLSSAARPWFKLGFMDPGMDKFRQYRNWLDDTEKSLYGVFRRSNFYSVIHHLYEEIGGFGSGAMFADAHDKNVVNFTVFTAGDYRFSVKPDGRLHTLMRYFQMQAAQAAAEFGAENLSERGRRLLTNNQFDWIDIYHVLEPNDQYDPSMIDSKPWISAYFESKTEREDKKLSYGGYQECPAICPRWMALSNEAYSWGPGPETLQITKALQRCELSSMKAADKMIDPPVSTPPSMASRMLDLTPGAKNSLDEVDGQIRPIITINPNALDFFDKKIARIEYRIRQNFYNQIFLMISQQPVGGDKMTAAEIVARNQEKMMMLGPVVESQEYEGLGPIVERTFALAARAGMLPPPPAELRETQYKVEFISVLAQAQKLLSTQGQDAYLMTAERVAMVDPRSVMKTNWNAFLEEKADSVGMPSKILRPDEEVAQMLAQIDQQAAEERQMAAGAAEIDAVSKLGKTPAGGEDNALGQMSQAASGE